MKPVEWRPRAERDVADTAYWYAQKGGLVLGQRFIAEVDGALERIAAHPGIGSARHALVDHGLSAPVRFLVLRGFPRHLVYYLDLPQHIDVVRIWCADRGLQALVDDAP